MQKKHFLLIAFVMGFMHDIRAVNFGYGTDFNAGGVQFSIFRNDQIKGEVIAAVVGLILATKVAYDVSWHNVYDAQVCEYYQGLKKHTSDDFINDVTDEKLLNFSTEATREDVLSLEESISNSYNSWLCPWNWTASQKIAYQHIQIVSIFTLYAELLRAGNKLSDQDILQHCRNTFVFTTMYPYVACHSKIQKHLNFIKSFADNEESAVICSMLRDMAIHLEKFKRMLQSQKEYVDELQIMRTHALQQESINAQRRRRY
ncbi:MAG: hypothetical protein WC747_00190 [Candidatus Babeliales bacterium]